MHVNTKQIENQAIRIARINWSEIKRKSGAREESIWDAGATTTPYNAPYISNKNVFRLNILIYVHSLRIKIWSTWHITTIKKSGAVMMPTTAKRICLTFLGLQPSTINKQDINQKYANEQKKIVQIQFANEMSCKLVRCVALFFSTFQTAVDFVSYAFFNRSPIRLLSELDRTKNIQEIRNKSSNKQQEQKKNPHELT